MPSYLWGSFNDKTGPTTGIVTFSKTNGTTTATVKIQILYGNIPVNGSLITVVGSANGAAFNVTNVAISNVTVIPDANGNNTGLYSLTYAITSTATPTTYTADAAQFIIPQPEVAEALAAGASAPVVMPYNIMNANMNQALTAVISFPSLPTSVIVTLQQAVQDIDAEYQDVASVVTVSGGAVTVGGQITVDPTLGRFFRFKNGTVVGGTLPTLVAKLLL
jgi:hypothetical protein